LSSYRPHVAGRRLRGNEDICTKKEFNLIKAIAYDLPCSVSLKGICGKDVFLPTL
jgi:hypothetical protein